MSEAALTGERAAEAWTSFNLRGGPSAAAQARAAIEPLRPTIGDEVSGDLVLIVSELVTNAYRHSGAAEEGIGVDVEVIDDRVHGEIADRGPGFRPEPVPEKRRGEGGWGLFIVDQLADRWGVRAGTPSKVWFDLVR